MINLKIIVFFNVGNSGRNNYRDFGELAKKGHRIIKPTFSDTLILIDGERRIFFEIIDCCNNE